MLKREHGKQKQLKTNSPDNNNDKALNRLASFFNTKRKRPFCAGISVRFGQEHTQGGQYTPKQYLF